MDLDLSGLDAWMQLRLIRLRDELDARERNRIANAAARRSHELHWQSETRQQLQWFVRVDGVGHGSPTGEKPIDEPPSTMYRVRNNE